MERVIPQIIEELEYLNNLSSKYEPLVAYYKEFGTISNISVADTYNYQGKDIHIGMLVANLRRPERKAKLTAKEIELLDNMGMIWNAYQEHNRLEPLIAYYNQFGTIAHIKHNDIYEHQGKQIKIGVLIRNLRTLYVRGTLDEKRINKLNSMGMVWKIYEDGSRLAPLKAYYQEFGTIANISVADTYNYQDKEIRIGSLVNHLRYEYKNGELSSEEIQILNDIGMVWSVRNMVKFKDRLEPLVAYYKEFGTIANIQTKDSYIYKGNKVKIGLLLISLRHEYKQGKLDNDKISLLNSMGMVWDKFREHFRLEPIKAYYEEFGSLEGIKYADTYLYQGKNLEIGHLINNLRYEYRQGTLDETAVKLLNDMGMDWGRTKRYDRLLPLKAYYKEFGTIATITTREVYNYNDKDINIGVLIRGLRKEYKKSKLSADEIELLNSLGMLWTVGRGNKTQKNLMI